jgi:hypothetical protein
MPPAVKEVSLQPTLMDETAPTTGLQRKDESQPVPATHGNNLVLMFERLASDPNVNVEKLERLIELQERIMAHNAEAAFNVAFAQMLPKIPTIAERARTDKTAYAPLEDIIEVVRPILSEYGFSLSFRTEWPDPKTVRVVGILTHEQGHARTSEFLSGADQTGSKNAIQALGSSVSYGKRYTAKDLLCIVTREDDDGETSERAQQPAEPEGYDNWWLDLELVAEKGWPALSQAYNKSKPDFRTYTAKNRRREWEALKAKAEKAKPQR